MSGEERPSRSLGFLGGTFDPVHWGHLRAASAVREALCLDALYLVPARLPPHRGEPQSAPEDRLAMLRAAVAEVPGLAVDARELRRQGKSYSYDTLAELRAQYPDAALYFILGADAFHGLPLWHRWRELTDWAHLVVMNRPGETRPWPPELAAWLASRRADSRTALGDAKAGRVLFLAVPPHAISATELRRRLAAGEPADDLLPASVLAYIHSHHLYQRQADGSDPS